MKDIIINYYRSCIHGLKTASFRTRLGELFLLVLLPLLVYLSAFVTEYGINGDYNLIPGSFADRKIWFESPFLCCIGRPLAALLMTLLSWCVQGVSDLGVWRFISFMLTGCSVVLFAMFLRRRCGVDQFWANAIALNILFLPATQVFILWVAIFIMGPLTFLLALFSYFCLDLAQKERPSQSRRAFVRQSGLLLASFVIFWAALLIYPPTALSVFIFPFCYLIFPEPNRELKLKIRIWCEMAFYGLTLAVFYILQTKLFIPWARENFKTFVNDQALNYYKFEISSALRDQFKLILNTLWASLSGAFHPFWDYGTQFSLAIVVVGLTGIFLAKKKQAGNLSFLNGVFLRDVVFSVLTGVVLFLFANCAALCAALLQKSFSTLYNYRIVFPASVMMALVLFGVLYRWELFVRSAKGRFALRIFACCLVLLSSGFTAKNNADVARLHNQEMTFIRQKAMAVKGNDIRRFLVSFYSWNIKFRRMPFEFSMFITNPTQAQDIIDEVRTRSGLEPLPVDFVDDNLIFLDDQTSLIDFDEIFTMEKPGTANKHRIHLSISSDPAFPVEIYHKDGFFLFQQQVKGKTVPFWFVPPTDQKDSWLQFYCLDGPRHFKAFMSALFGSQIDQPWPTQYKVQGSQDGQHWESLIVNVLPTPAKQKNYNFYLIQGSRAYSYYRFHLLNFMKEVIPVKAVFMILKE